jgi:hypothetical protein
MPSFVMYEEDWFKLCAKLCKARRKQYGYKLKDCRDENECGICPECASEAAASVPKKYRTTPERAAHYDTLPGL